MNIPSLLVVFPDKLMANYETMEEHHIWNALHEVYDRRAFEEKPAEELLTLYQTEKFNSKFYELQLKFFIIRYINYGPTSENIQPISYWLGKMKIIDLSISIIILGIQTHFTMFNQEMAFTKYYYYSPKRLNAYLAKWYNQTITLDLWKKHGIIQISNEFSFLKTLKEDEGLGRATLTHMHNLFREYVDEIYNEKMKHRLNNSLLAERDKAILERLFNNTAIEADKQYLGSLFNLEPRDFMSEDISRCLAGEDTIVDTDIHSRDNLSAHFAVIDYYQALKSLKKKKKKSKPYAMWFKNIPTGEKQKAEFYEQLGTLFEDIKVHCRKNTWKDFKSIFYKSGTATKIDWNGDGGTLAFIFRKMGRHIEYSGEKWEVISFYFNPHKKENLKPNRLKFNSHIHNEHLETKIKKLIATLTR